MRAVGFIGNSGVGKTTLIVKLLERFTRAGLRVGAVKHDAHEFQMDREGKDTFRFSQAGAAGVAIASKTRRAVLVETGRPSTLAELLATLPEDLDGVLVEGYRGEAVPAIEVHRRGLPRLGLPQVLAVVSDDDRAGGALPRFERDDVDGVCRLLLGLLEPR